MKLLRVQLFEPVQFEQPLGVTKSFSSSKGPVQVCTIEEHKDGSLIVIVTNSRLHYVHHITAANVAHKVYQPEEKRVATAPAAKGVES